MDADGQSRSEVMRRLARQEIIFPLKNLVIRPKVQSNAQEQLTDSDHKTLKKASENTQRIRKNREDYPR